jgi:hypothetical protein
MSARYNPNMGFQGKGFQSGDSKCNPINEKEYYNTQYTPMFDGKGGAKSKKSSSATKKHGGSDAFAEIDKINSSLSWATQAGGTELASEYYTSLQQGSYSPYNASKDEKCGGGRKKKVHYGGIGMGEAEGRMGGSMGKMNGSMASCKASTAGGGCGCGLKMKTSGTKQRGGDDNVFTGNDEVIETEDTLHVQLDGGAKTKKRSTSSKTKSKSKTSSKTKSKSKTSTKTKSKSKTSTKTKSKSKTLRKYKGGDDSAGTGSDFATTLASRGPCNYPDGKSADLFRIFNKTSEFIPNSMLKYAAAPVSTGYAPDPNPYPRAFNDDFIGGTKKTKKPAKKSSSSKSKAKPSKKSTSLKTKAKPSKKSASSKSKTKKH